MSQIDPIAASARAARPAPMSGSAPVVELIGAGKVFGTGQTSLTAVDGIDLSIAPGEFVSLIGPSGCGKSTLLRLIGDLTAATAGTVRVNGKTAAEARRGREYGIVFQAPVLFDWRTVDRNVELPLEIMGVARAERRERAAQMLSLVELGEFAHKYPWQLSGGMQQRVAIARALSIDPKLLLMDEPFGALDEMTRERMNLEVMRIWRTTQTTVVFVTHSIPEAVFLSTRVVVMSARPGRITRVVDVDLPQPRTFETRETEGYFQARDRGARGAAPAARGRRRRARHGSHEPDPRRGVRVTAAALARSGPSAWSRRLHDALPIVTVFVVVVVSWEFSLQALGVKQFLMPRPSVIATALVDQWTTLSRGTSYTATESIGGLLIGTLLGIGAAFATSRWTSARQALLPVAITANSIPIIALAPLTNIWFGSDNQVSRMAIVAVMVFFPVMVNVVRGLTEVDPAALELMQASAASSWQVLAKVRIPNALPFVFTGLKVSTTLSVIGAVVGEYFGGPQYALGVYIKSEAYVFRYMNAWAAIIIASLLGIGLYVAVVVLERLVLPWHASNRRALT